MGMGISVRVAGSCRLHVMARAADLLVVVAVVALVLMCEAAPLFNSADAAEQASLLGEDDMVDKLSAKGRAMAKADLKQQVFHAVKSIKKNTRKIKARTDAVKKMKKERRKEKKEARREERKIERVLQKQDRAVRKDAYAKAKAKSKKIAKKDLRMHRPAKDEAAGWNAIRKGNTITAENDGPHDPSIKVKQHKTPAVHCEKCKSMCKTNACRTWCDMRWCSATVKLAAHSSMKQQAKKEVAKVKGLLCKGCSTATGAKREFCKRNHCA